MRVGTTFNLANWLRMVKFIELNISELCAVNFTYKSHHWKFSKTLIMSGIFAISEIGKFKFQ